MKKKTKQWLSLCLTMLLLLSTCTPAVYATPSDPQLTGSITVIGTSGEVKGEEGRYAFDNDKSTKWCDTSHGDTGWLAFSFQNPVVVTAMKVYHASGYSEDPKECNTVDFALQVLKDEQNAPGNLDSTYLANDSNWQNLISVHNNAQDSITENSTSNTKAHKYYRFRVTDGDRRSDWLAVRIHEIELFGKTVGRPLYETFEPGRGTGEAFHRTIQDRYASTELPQCPFTPPVGYMFRGWESQNNKKEFKAGTRVSYGNVETDTLTWIAMYERDPNAKVSITFEPNGGGGTMASQTVTYGTSYQLPNCAFTPPKGHSFYRWDVNGKEHYENEIFQILDNVTVKPIWKPYQYSMQYRPAGGGGEMSSQTAAHGSNYTILDCAFTPPEGMEFSHWTMNGQRYMPGQVIPVEGGLTLSASWKWKTYAVTFNSNGGAGEMQAQEAEHGQDFTLPDCTFTPPEGKTFSHWRVNGNTYQPQEVVQLTAPTEVTAVWKIKTYAVTFNANGGAGKMQAQVVEHGKNFTLPNCTFTPPEGKTFSHWDVGGQSYQPQASLQLTADTEVKAIWKNAFYTVQFDENGGTGQMNSKTVLDGTVYTLPACTFTAPEGKEFSHWEIGGQSYQPQAEYTVKQAVTVRAIWKWKTYPVSFEANGAKGTMAAQTVEHGTEYPLPTCTFTPQTGYEFSHWDVNGQSYQPQQTVTVTTKTVVKAVWKKQTMTVQFQNGGGAGQMQSVQVEYGTGYTLPACTFTAPKNHAFIGWKLGDTSIKQVGETLKVTENLQITALWKVLPKAEFYNGNQLVNTLYADTLQGGKLVLPTMNNTESQVFNGWELDGTRYAGQAEFSLGTKDVVFRATWKKIPTLQLPQFKAFAGQTLSMVSLSACKADTAGRFYWKNPTEKIRADQTTYILCFAANDTEQYTPIVEKEVPISILQTVLVHFYAGEGNGYMPPQMVVQNEDFILPSCTLIAPIGKHFARWDQGETGQSIRPSGSMIVLPIWEDGVEIVAYGQENGVSWSLTSDGFLSVNSSNATLDFGDKVAPWAAFITQIRTVTLQEGIENLPAAILEDTPYLRCVRLPSSTSTLPTAAMQQQAEVQYVTIGGSAADKAVQAAGAKQLLYGDVDQNGTVEKKDYIDLRNFVMDFNATPTEEQLHLMDIDGDGVIDAFDLVAFDKLLKK